MSATNIPPGQSRTSAERPAGILSNIPFAADPAQAMSAGRIGSWTHLIDRDEIWGDRIVADLLGLDFAAQPWRAEDFYQVVHPDDVARVSAAVEDAYSGKTPYYDVEIRRHPSLNNPNDPEDFWVGARAEVTERDGNGAPLRIAGVNWDVSEFKRVEQRLSMLASEMDHRVKNAFAVIRAMIRIGARKFPDSKPFADTLRGQVEALGTAHTLSARMARQHRNARAKVALRDVIETALAPWMHNGDLGDPDMIITCDRTIEVEPTKIASFAMMLYELSTNATKHGALSERGGTLNVSVTQTTEDVIAFRWQEVFETPVPLNQTQAAHNGFGRTLLEHTSRNLASQFATSLTEDGLTFEINIPT